jgi:glycosyltransferase involved in cell wall biosynthesis
VKVLLYSRGFYPAVGGIESVSLALAQRIAGAGHTCVVVTETLDTGAGADDGPAPFPFGIERAPSARRRWELVRAADLVHSNGASLALFFHAKLIGKPFLWTHAGYQMVSVDGLGWMDGKPAPLTPLASVLFHARKKGLRVAGVAAVKLGIRRAAGLMVDRNVAVSRWVANRQPLPRQVVIYNPFSLSLFTQAARVTDAPHYDFLYVGRLVSEKGVGTLLRALAALNTERTRGARPRPAARLLIVGDGAERAALEQLALSLGVAANVHFAGRKQGQELVQAMAQAAVAVVPSEWEEAMGGVALELLTAGLPLIVSERGGLAECVADAAWTFPNGDPDALAARMAAVIDDPVLRSSKAGAARLVLQRFDERALAQRYLDLYAELLTGRT